MAFIAALSYGACKQQENFAQQLCMFLSAYVRTYVCVCVYKYDALEAFGSPAELMEITQLGCFETNHNQVSEQQFKQK